MSRKTYRDWTTQEDAALIAAWYGPPGSGHGPGEPWVPGQAFKRAS